MSGGATKIEESSLGKDDDTMSIWEYISINLWLNFGTLDSWVFLKSSHVDLIIEMSNISNDGVVLHLSHMVGHDDSLISCGSDEDITCVDNVLEFLDLETFHASLKGANWVNFGDDNSSSTGLHSSGRSFTNITISADDDFLTSDHDISSSHETIWKRVSASINVIELLLGDGVVNVDGSNDEFSLGGHLIESVNTGGSLLRHSNELGSHLGPFLGLSSLETLSDNSHDLLELKVVVLLWVWKLSSLLEVSLSLDSLVDEKGSITTIINKNIWTIISWPCEHFVGAVPVLLKSLSLPGENVGGLGLDNSSSGMVLGGVDVARSPSNFSSKSVKGFDQNSSLDGHVE